MLTKKINYFMNNENNNHTFINQSRNRFFLNRRFNMNVNNNIENLDNIVNNAHLHNVNQLQINPPVNFSLIRHLNLLDNRLNVFNRQRQQLNFNENNQIIINNFVRHNNINIGFNRINAENIAADAIHINNLTDQLFQYLPYVGVIGLGLLLVYSIKEVYGLFRSASEWMSSANSGIENLLEEQKKMRIDNMEIGEKFLEKLKELNDRTNNLENIDKPNNTNLYIIAITSSILTQFGIYIFNKMKK